MNFCFALLVSSSLEILVNLLLGWVKSHPAALSCSQLPFSKHNLLLLFFFNFYSVTIVCIFSPSLHPTPAEPTSFPHLYPPPWFCPCVLYSSSYNPLSSLSPPLSSLSIVRLFLTSMSLVISFYAGLSELLKCRRDVEIHFRELRDS